MRTFKLLRSPTAWVTGWTYPGGWTVLLRGRWTLCLSVHWRPDWAALEVNLDWATDGGARAGYRQFVI